MSGDNGQHYDVYFCVFYFCAAHWGLFLTCPRSVLGDLRLDEDTFDIFFCIFWILCIFFLFLSIFEYFFCFFVFEVNKNLTYPLLDPNILEAIWDSSNLVKN